MTKTFAQMQPEERQSYEEGIKLEEHVRELLNQAGFKNVHKGSEFEDVCLDIDLHDEDGNSFSVKCNEPKYYTAPFLFELRVQKKGNPKLIPSWYFTGKAKYYAMYKRHENGGGTVFLLDKAKLVEYINTHGWYKVTGQTSDVAKTQASWKDIEYTELGLMSQSDLLRAGVARIIISDVKPATAPKKLSFPKPKLKVKVC